MLDGAGDPSAQVGQFGPDAERMAVLSAEQIEAVWQAAAVVPQTLLDADTRAVAARQMFDARRTPELARAAREATSIVRSAERLVACLPVPHVRSRRSRPGVTPMGKADGSRCLPCPRRWHWWRASRRAITRPAGPLSAACRDRWTDLARQAPDMTSIDLVLAEALIAGAERARLAEETA